LLTVQLTFVSVAADAGALKTKSPAVTSATLAAPADKRLILDLLTNASTIVDDVELFVSSPVSIGRRNDNLEIS
jgi:hypothetical protein